MPHLASNKSCTGCMLCGSVCPHNAITFNNNDYSYYPHVDYNKCIECKLCEKKCPEINKTPGLRNLTLLSPIACWSTNYDIRKRSASGGAFYEIANAFISKSKLQNRKWNIVGAILRENEVRLELVSKNEELHLLQGTKYLPSIPADIYKTVSQLLRKGENVLFSGLPCQINALYYYINNKSYTGTLLTCDLICNGVPSNYLLNLTLGNTNKVISFRDKDDGWGHNTALKYIDKNGILQRKTLKDSFFLKAFSKNILLRRSCYNCKYCNLLRNSDITLGDWWGCNLTDTESRDGVSLVIPHNTTAIEYINEASLCKQNIRWSDCLPHNPRIFDGKRFVQYAIPYTVKSHIKCFSESTIYELLTGEMYPHKSKSIFFTLYSKWLKFLQRKEAKRRESKCVELLKQIEND